MDEEVCILVSDGRHEDLMCFNLQFKTNLLFKKDTLITQLPYDTMYENSIPNNVTLGRVQLRNQKTYLTFQALDNNPIKQLDVKVKSDGFRVISTNDNIYMNGQFTKVFKMIAQCDQVRVRKPGPTWENFPELRRDLKSKIICFNYKNWSRPVFFVTGADWPGPFFQLCQTLNQVVESRLFILHYNIKRQRPQLIGPSVISIPSGTYVPNGIELASYNIEYQKMSIPDESIHATLSTNNRASLGIHILADRLVVLLLNNITNFNSTIIIRIKLYNSVEFSIKKGFFKKILFFRIYFFYYKYLVEIIAREDEVRSAESEYVVLVKYPVPANSLLMPSICSTMSGITWNSSPVNQLRVQSEVRQMKGGSNEQCRQVVAAREVTNFSKYAALIRSRTVNKRLSKRLTSTVLPNVYTVYPVIFVTENTSTSYVEMSFQESTVSGAALITKISGKLVPTLFNATSGASTQKTPKCTNVFKKKSSTIYLRDGFDFEQCSAYRIHTIDTATRALITKIRISIMDVDEFIPRIVNGPNITLYVAVTAAVGSIIGNIVTADDDGGVYGNITFLNEGSDIEIGSNGDVILLQKPDVKQFVVSIQASSGMLTVRVKIEI